MWSLLESPYIRERLKLGGWGVGKWGSLLEVWNHKCVNSDGVLCPAHLALAGSYSIYLCFLTWKTWILSMNTLLHPCNSYVCIYIETCDCDWDGKSPIAYKGFRHVENLLIQGFLFIHPRFVFIIQPISEPVR